MDDTNKSDSLNNTPQDINNIPRSENQKIPNIWKAFQSMIIVAILSATVFTMWTPANLFSNQLLDRMKLALQSQEIPEDPVQEFIPTPTTPQRMPIGIVAGHWQHDPGAVCQDGTTEAQVNLVIATLVRQSLIEEGFDVDLLAEFDDKLIGYQALALISIHNDSCEYINDEATGFKVSASMSTASAHPEKGSRLTACMTQRYQSITGLQFHHNTVTNDMRYYHAFDEIHENTPALIIETGFLNLDRQILTEQPDLIADGVVAGILCYIRNEPIPVPE